MKAIKLIIIALNLFVGGLMISGGLEKFKGETPSPNKMIEQVKAGEEIAPNDHVLVLKNYVFGMKQTGYFWPFLGIMELLAGALLISQVFSKIGAIIAFPITVNIFLFHAFLEPDELGELAMMTVMLIANAYLILRTKKTWKPLLYDKESLALKG
ncbi:MAG: DoxX family membrane protein [Flavobacterium sp.]